jgi:hypothetical protein
LIKHDIDAMFKKLKGKPKLDEDIHCALILKIMADPNKGRMSAFCVEVCISDFTFYNWLKQSDLFLQCYALGKMIARENWEYDGQQIREEVTMPGTSNHKFEHWRMVGWSRFGVGKNSRIRLDLDPKGTPNQHYQQLMHQASQGDFTAGEIKQLMEAINIGLTAHQVEVLQQEIDQLKADLITMTENSNGDNPFADKRTT